MLAKCYSGAVNGVDARTIEIEVYSAVGTSQFAIVGLPDTAVKEAKDRIPTALKNQGLASRKEFDVTVNLAPADVKKEGPIYDLPIAICLLKATGRIGNERLDEYAFVGELSLSGEVRSVRGILPIVMEMKRIGRRAVVVPMANADEASVVGGIDVIAVRTLQEAAPQADLEYRFVFYGRYLSTLSEEMDLNHSVMTDEGAAVREILPLMKHCKRLDMDSCGVSSERMAEIRDAYPEMEVIWRIWFANDQFTMRTDSERLWCANFYPYMWDEYTQELKYLTNLKYLDLGHNLELHDWSFMRTMTNLEVCIITASGWDTLDMLENCTKLEFLEIVPWAHIELDLTPLAGMQDLEHLNICGMGQTQGWEVLLGMPKLKRLWIGSHTAYFFPEGAMDQILAAHPDTNILYLTDGAATGSWRVDERYQLLRQQFDYDRWPSVAPYPYNDPKYNPPW